MHELSWRRLFRWSVMKDADRLITVHGPNASAVAMVGVKGNRELSGHGYWSDVADEIRRRSLRIAAAWSRCL